MIPLITSRLNIPRWAAWLAVAVIAVVLVYAAWSVWSWRVESQKTAQTKLNNSASDAQANAAAKAIDTVMKAESRDKTVDQAVSAAQKEIRNAPNPQAARATVVATLCGMRSYANDPACKVQ